METLTNNVLFQYHSIAHGLIRGNPALTFKSNRLLCWLTLFHSRNVAYFRRNEFHPAHGIITRPCLCRWQPGGDRSTNWRPCCRVHFRNSSASSEVSPESNPKWWVHVQVKWYSPAQLQYSLYKKLAHENRDDTRTRSSSMPQAALTSIYDTRVWYVDNWFVNKLGRMCLPAAMA